MQLEVPAIGALECCRDRAFVGQPAAIAEGRLDEPDFGPAAGTDVTFRRGGAVFVAKLANGRIEQGQPGLKTADNSVAPEQTWHGWSVGGGWLVLQV